MSAAELTPRIDALPRVEKIQLLQFLITSMTKEEQIILLDSTVTYRRIISIRSRRKTRSC
jgi:hypothetical protein